MIHLSEKAFPLLTDEDIGRYARFVLHCQRAGGEYQGDGQQYERDFGIGRYVIEDTLRLFAEKGLITFSCTGISTWPRGEDLRVWSLRIASEAEIRSSGVVHSSLPGSREYP